MAYSPASAWILVMMPSFSSKYFVLASAQPLKSSSIVSSVAGPAAAAGAGRAS